MSFYAEFLDLTPGPRLAPIDTPWEQVRLAYSAVRGGPFVAYETQALDPLDTDPEDPQSRDITTTAAPAATGWHTLTFIDAALDEQVSDPLYYPGGTGAEFRPTVAEIGALLWARTKDDNSNVVGTFTADTRPTAVQVELLITQGINDVLMRVGTWVPTDLLASAQTVVGLRAAQLVELSYFPEQTDGDAVIYQTLRLSYEEQLAKLVIAVQLRMVFSEPVEETV